MTEKELQVKMVNYFKKYFEVYEEVWSEGHKKRIDLVLIHKSDQAKKYPFGIELKKSEIKQGKEIYKWLNQASVYSDLSFIGFGKLIVLVAPSISFNYLKEGELMNNHQSHKAHSNVNTFIAKFGVGEIIKDEYNGKSHFLFVFNSLILFNSLWNKLNINAIERLMTWKTQK